MATISPAYRLKPESPLSTQRPDEALLAAPLLLWKEWVPRAILSDHLAKVQELEAAPDVDAQEEELDNHRKQIITLRTEKEVQENRFLALEKAVATLEKTVETQKDEITTLEKTVETQKVEITTLEKTVAAQKDEITTLENTVETQQDEITRKRKEITDIQAERKTSEEELSARTTALEQQMEEWGSKTRRTKRARQDE